MLGAIGAGLRRAMAEPDATELLQNTGLLPDTLDGEQLAAALRSEHGFWVPLIRDSGFKPES